MFVVLEYFNYRKNSTINLVCFTSSEDMARERAYKLAYDMYDGNVLDLKTFGRFNEYVILEGDILVQYSSGDGYDRMIYAVVKVPELVDKVN
jgi:hypothetical protein